jgi:cation diffusion facilitator family transporter
LKKKHGRQILQQPLNKKKDYSPYIRKVTWIGFGVNVLLTCIKFAAGIFGQSQALVADAVHSLSDTVTDLAVILGSFFWSEPPDQCHPYGHQRIETMVTLAIGAILFMTGAGIGWHAITTMRGQSVPPPTGIALGAAVLSLITKEILFQWTDRVGKKIRSTALSANAWHHRLDAISSIPVMVALAGSMLFPNLTFLDSAGALIVSVFIIQAAFKIMIPGFGELLGRGAPEDTLASINDLVMAHPEVITIHKLRTRYLGANLYIDFHLVLNRQLTIQQGHDIAERIRTHIISTTREIADIVIRIEPGDPS